MKKLLNAGLLSLGLAMTASVSAQEDENTQDFCQEFARLVEATADLRDQGATRDQLEEAANDYPDNPWYELRVNAVDMVFTYPKLSPIEEGNVAYSSCMDTYG